jgi:sigma-B regulation protein RsbU (phosphoserine phosphatase)
MMASRDDPSQDAGFLREVVRSAIAEVSGAMDTRESVTGYDSALLAEFVDASRRAVSNAEALRLALATLRERLDASWVAVVEGDDAHEPSFAGSAAAEGTAPPSALPAQAFLRSRVTHHSTALPIDAGDLEAWARWARDHRPEHVDEIEALDRAGVRAAVALRGKDEIIGLLLLGPPIGRDRYTAPERRTLRHSADQLALMLENGRLTARILEQEKLRRDVALAAEVQRRLLPHAPPERREVMLSAVTMAARNVAGDYYDFLDLDDGRLAIALADVSGKGIPAALIMSVVQASLRIISTDASLPLPTLASRMNDFIYRSTQSNSYATFFYGRLDERSLELQFVNAGHNPPMLARARDGAATIEELRAGGTVLGLFPVAGFDSDSVMLERGDVLLIFTDGVPESLNTTGDEFGEERLKQVLREGITLTAGELADLLSRELTQWSAGAPQHDDLTFVVMKVDRPTA